MSRLARIISWALSFRNLPSDVPPEYPAASPTVYPAASPTAYPAAPPRQIRRSPIKEERDERILFLYYDTGLCVERIARSVGCSVPTVNKVVARNGSQAKAELGAHHQIPRTLRGRRWD